MRIPPFFTEIYRSLDCDTQKQIKTNLMDGAGGLVASITPYKYFFGFNANTTLITTLPLLGIFMVSRLAFFKIFKTLSHFSYGTQGVPMFLTQFAHHLQDIFAYTTAMIIAPLIGIGSGSGALLTLFILILLGRTIKEIYIAHTAKKIEY